MLVLSQAAVRSPQAALDSDAAARRQTQTDNDASGTPQLVKDVPGWGVGVATWATRYRTSSTELIFDTLSSGYAAVLDIVVD